MTMHAEDFAEPALDTVAIDCAAERSWRGDSQPRVSGRTSQTKCRKQRIRDAGALVIDRSKIGGAQDLRGLRKEKFAIAPTAGCGIRREQRVLLFRR